MLKQEEKSSSNKPEKLESDNVEKESSKSRVKCEFSIDRWYKDD
jgi:hypothetical protein